MAIAHVGSTTANSGAALATSFVINKPAGVTDGHVGILNISISLGTGATVPTHADWTLVKRTDRTTNHSLLTYIRRHTAADPASWNWTGITSSDFSVGLSAYSGVNTTTAQDATLTASSGAASFSAVCPAITTATNGAQVLNVVGVNDDTFTNATVTPPTGNVERYDVINAGFSVQMVAESSDFEQVAAGDTGTKTATISQSRTWIAHTMALRPLPADITPPAAPTGLTATVIGE